MSNETQSFKATILTISDEIKTKSNGKQFQVCTVKFLDGAIKGKTYFAQRTIGADKALIAVNQEVTCYMTISEGKPFFEVSTSSSVDNAEDLMSLLGVKATVPTNVAPIGEKSPF